MKFHIHVEGIDEDEWPLDVYHSSCNGWDHS